MPAVPSWAPAQFDLTNPYNGSMSFNVQTVAGLYVLDRGGCDFAITVRSTTDNVPQSDGSILHHRFLTGTQMALRIVLMEDEDRIACDDLLSEMLDNITGAFRSLLNAGDNQGRLAWEIAGGNERMLDDIRLLIYPSFLAGEALPTVQVTIDSQFPYAQDLTQIPTAVADGATEVLTNTGTAAYFPVFRVEGPTSAFTITVVHGSDSTEFVYDSTQPGAVAIAGGNCAEINTFMNTIYLDIGCTGAGDDSNLKAGVVELQSDYPSLGVGANSVSISGADMTVLWAPAWG